ncbi:hypothetical protein PSME7519_24350 [Ectopseudomonas mendocina]
MQVFQQAIADATVRHLAQVFLGALEGRVPVVAGLQQERIETGEPTQSLARIQVIEQRLATMAFQGNQALRLPVPVAQGMRQRGEQQIVDLRAVRRWRLTQQRIGGDRVELHIDALGTGREITPLRVVCRQPAVARQRLPVGTLGRHFGTRRIGDETLTPALPGTALGPQIGHSAYAQLGVSALQIIEQDAPGNAIDQQVVHHQ